MDRMIEQALLLLVLLSWLYWTGALFSVHFFFRRYSPKMDFTPPVSILKPVKGLDFQAYENFASFCTQDYPEYEILFGVLSPEDPTIPVIKRLKKEFPQRTIRLIVGEPLGQNAKISNLYHLERKAKYNILVIVDSDMRVRPDYLRRVVGFLADPKVGLVTALYRAVEPESLTARLEALYIGASFIASAIVGKLVLGMNFALGATLALRREDLYKLDGGFKAFQDHLADDHELGSRIGALGYRVLLCNYTLDYVVGRTRFRDQWDREVRWARCIKVTHPWGYLGLILTFSIPLGLLYAIAVGLQQKGLMVLMGSILIRWMLTWEVTHYTEDRVSRKCLLWLPLRDVLTVLVWLEGMLGRRVTWRGETFYLSGDGRLQPVPEAVEQAGRESAQYPDT